jgi:hypothetical protein
MTDCLGVEKNAFLSLNSLIDFSFNLLLNLLLFKKI